MPVSIRFRYVQYVRQFYPKAHVVQSTRGTNKYFIKPYVGGRAIAEDYDLIVAWRKAAIACGRSTNQ